MDTDKVKQQYKQLQERIQNVSKATDYQAEVEKRQLWRTLALLKMSLDNQELSVSEEFSKEFQQTYPSVAEMLSLKKHASKSAGWMGPIRFGAFFMLTFIMFPIFIAAFPLRWLHPHLRKLGLKNNQLPYDFVPRLWAAWSMLIFGLESRIEGWENIQQHADNGTSTIGLFEHSSFYDFITVMGSCRLLFKWVAKKSLYMIPMLGQMAWLSGMIPIDRGNIEAAKRSLERAAVIAQKYKRSIAISPEGTRSNNGQLIEFKKGAFHLALKCQVDATPMVLFGAYHLWPPGSILPSPGVVTLRFLKPIRTRDYLPDNYNQMLRDTRIAMLDAMANPPPQIAGPISTTYAIMSYITVAATYGAFIGGVVGIWKFFQ